MNMDDIFSVAFSHLDIVTKGENSLTELKRLN